MIPVTPLVKCRRFKLEPELRLLGSNGTDSTGPVRLGTPRLSTALVVAVQRCLLL